MSNSHENELVVSEGKKSRPEKFIAVFFYAIFFLLLLAVGYSVFIDESSWIFIQSIYAPLTAALFCLALALNYSIEKAILIDFKKDKLIYRFSFGPYEHDQLSTVPKLEYVAVFKNIEGVYEVNLWHSGNKHYRMAHYDTADEAFDYSAKASKRLDLKLLDATHKNNFTWVES